MPQNYIDKETINVNWRIKNILEYYKELFDQNQRRDISTQKSVSLKLLDKFTYLGSSVSSTENDIKMGLTKAW